MNTGYVSAVEMLAMPRAASLPTDRIEGTSCVWCGRAPTLPLGPRISVIDGELHRWHPRSCQSCASQESARVYDIHIGSCARCRERDYCPDSRALLELAGSPASIGRQRGTVT